MSSFKFNLAGFLCAWWDSLFFVEGLKIGFGFFGVLTEIGVWSLPSNEGLIAFYPLFLSYEYYLFRYLGLVFAFIREIFRLSCSIMVDTFCCLIGKPRYCLFGSLFSRA